MTTNEEKLKVPYIERFNGNVAVKRGEHELAIAHYNKALLSMKMIFQVEEDQDPPIKTEGQALKLIIDIEVNTCSNLALCYNKIGKYHEAIKYAKQALEKDPNNSKASFRMAQGYINLGELERAKDTLLQLNEREGLENEFKVSVA